MRYAIVSRVLICGALLVLQACSHARVTDDQSAQAEQPSQLPAQDTEKAVLAGEWEYEEDGMVVPLKLDRYGNGTYDFKDGRFRTEVLSDHHWVGGWAQRANNREGGFEISLSPDFFRRRGSMVVHAHRRGLCAAETRRSVPRDEGAIEGGSSDLIRGSVSVTARPVVICRINDLVQR